MGGVQTYALLCEKVLGRAPAEVRLLHLRDPVAISAVATPQTLRGQQRRTSAVWSAIERACVNGGLPPQGGAPLPVLPFQAFVPRLQCRVREDVTRLDESMTRLDETVDAAFEPLRGRPQVDRAAALVSNLADYGFVWVVLAAAQGPAPGAGRRRAVVSLGTAGVSSLLVNRAAKSVVERQRPEEQLDVRGAHAHQQQLSERAHLGRLRHRLRPGRIHSRDSGLRRIRRRRGGQPGAPAGPSPERRAGRCGHRRRARVCSCVPWSTW